MAVQPSRPAPEGVHATFGGVLAANPAEAMELFQGAENENYRRLSQVPQGVLKKRRPL